MGLKLRDEFVDDSGATWRRLNKIATIHLGQPMVPTTVATRVRDIDTQVSPQYPEISTSIYSQQKVPRSTFTHVTHSSLVGTWLHCYTQSGRPPTTSVTICSCPFGAPALSALQRQSSARLLSCVARLNWKVQDVSRRQSARCCPPRPPRAHLDPGLADWQ